MLFGFARPMLHGQVPATISWASSGTFQLPYPSRAALGIRRNEQIIRLGLVLQSTNEAIKWEQLWNCITIIAGVGWERLPLPFLMAHSSAKC